jgi:GntR family transcriptional regulator / MocR family aminotransferase
MDLHLDLDSLPGGSMRARVEHGLRESIRGGRLAPGTRLPATRALCTQLGVSRGVIVDAYAQLTAEGYLHTRRGGGTLVAEALAVPMAATGAIERDPRVRYDLNPFRPALSGFPRTAWLSALGRVLRHVPDERLGYPDPAGMPELRAALAAYLGRVRGVRATPEQVLVTSGLRQGASLLWSVIASNGARRVAVEQPGWRGMGETVSDAGMEVVPVPVDEHGLLVDLLMGELVDAVALAPAHQYPTGAVLSPARRTALVAWARDHRVLIVEDDYDAEYRYDRHPIGSLQGLAPERVVYGGSTSKTLAPVMRLGWLVLPGTLAEQVARAQHRRGGMPSPLHQLAFADLIERGELDRHLRRQRRLYARRRELLLAALERKLPQVSVSGAAAGLYMLVGLPAGVGEQAALEAARAHGLALEGAGAAKPALVVGYANLAESSVDLAVDALGASIRQAGEQEDE